MIKKTILISGMHCKSCQILIEGKLREIDGVNDVQVSRKNNEAVIFSQKEISSGDIEAKLKDTGYAIGKDEKPWINKNFRVYKELLFSIVIILALVLIYKSLGISRINFNFGNPSSLIIVLLIGVTAGISSCMALVGGLVLGISSRFSEVHPDSSFTQKFRPHIFFNFGRILSFFHLIRLVSRMFNSI